MNEWAARLNKPVADGPPVQDKPAGPAKVSSGRAANAPKIAKLGNEQKAAQATEILVGLNTGTSVALSLAGLFATAGEITDREEVFREQAYAALLADSKLCDRIIKMGGSSGTFGLLMVYGMMLSAVVPTAREELAENKAAGRKSMFASLAGVFKSRKAEQE